MIASSILRARGYRNFTEIEGGINAVRKTELSRSKFVSHNPVSK
jgi:hydroxyacylglutathione hydrolase